MPAPSGDGRGGAWDEEEPAERSRGPPSREGSSVSAATDSLYTTARPDFFEERDRASSSTAADKGGSLQRSPRSTTLSGDGGRESLGGGPPPAAFAPMAFAPPNPLYGQSTMGMFRSGDWAFDLRERQEQQPSASFRPLPCPANPLFGRRCVALERAVILRGVPSQRVSASGDAV